MPKKKRLYNGCKPQHIAILAMAILALLFQLFKSNRTVINFMVDHITTPVKGAMAQFASLFNFSIGELLVYAGVLFALYFIIKSVVDVVRSRDKAALAYRRFLSLICVAMAIYTLFNFLWGINYYADTFQDKSGIRAQSVSKQQLYETTVIITQKLNEASRAVKRDAEGAFVADRNTLLIQSANLYKNIEQEFHFLARKGLSAKPVLLSEMLSYMDTTGFFFPFTAEANINVHCPLSLTPSTIAHEIAHQRDIASELEANFVAIVACDLSDIPEYAYSGYLLGYIHLGNALFQADFELWQQVRSTLDDGVVKDLADHSTYWKKYETPVSEISQSINDNRLKNYGQTLGAKSYGAVVDLLVAYYNTK